MNSKRLLVSARWMSAGAVLAFIVIFYRAVLHANTTTVALTLLLFILFLAARWGLQYAVVFSFVGAFCYNYFFLPPIGHFTISDPQNILALIAFLITSIIASRMSDRIRRESREAQARRAELEILYCLSRALLQTDELVSLANSLPASIAAATGATAVLLYLLDGQHIYRSGSGWTGNLTSEELKELSHAPGIISSSGAREAMIPLRTGVRPRGVLILRGAPLSHPSLDALGGLVSISLDRAGAIDEVTRVDAARKSDRLRSLMLDSIARELSEPISLIESLIAVLLQGESEPKATHEILATVHQQSKRVGTLLAHAMERSKLDTQELPLSVTSQHLDEIIADTLRIQRPMLDGHAVAVNFPPGLPKVEADPVWIQKLLGNLLENAVNYSNSEAPIFITAELSGSVIACSVADRGYGIEPLEQSLIFDEFFRSSTREQEVSGTGFGLALCRKIAEAHGGTISVTSQPGQGSVFTFTLRCLQSSDAGEGYAGSFSRLLNS